MKFKTYAVIILLLALAAGVYAWIQLKPQPPQQMAKVRVAQTGDFPLYVVLYVAKDKGIFALHGLNVEIASTGGDEKSAAAIISGQAQFGIGDPTFAAIANARGRNLRFISSIVNGAPFWGITYNQAVADKYAKSGLQGLTVATFPAPSTAYALQREMFATAGLPPKIKEGAFGSLEGILQAKGADIALELEPNVSLAQTRGAKILYSIARRVGKFTSTGVVVDSAWAKAHSTQVRGFCAAIDDSFNLIRKEPDAVAAVLAQRFPDIPIAVLKSAMDRSWREGVIPTSGRVDPAGWERSLELRAAVGEMSDIPRARSALDQSLCYPPDGVK